MMKNLTEGTMDWGRRPAATIAIILEIVAGVGSILATVAGSGVARSGSGRNCAPCHTACEVVVCAYPALLHKHFRR